MGAGGYAVEPGSQWQWSGRKKRERIERKERGRQGAGRGAPHAGRGRHADGLRRLEEGLRVRLAVRHVLRGRSGSGRLGWSIQTHVLLAGPMVDARECLGGGGCKLWLAAVDRPQQRCGKSSNRKSGAACPGEPARAASLRRSTAQHAQHAWRSAHSARSMLTSQVTTASKKDSSPTARRLASTCRRLPPVATATGRPGQKRRESPSLNAIC